AVALSSVIVGAAYVLTRRELVARAEAEAALRQSQERLRLAQRAGQLGAFEWDLRSGQSGWTAELEALYGLGPGGLGEGGDAWRQRLHPDDVAAAERAHAVAAANGGEFDTEFRVVRPDGTVRWLAGRGQVFRDGDGRPSRLVGVNVDVTDRK